MPKAHNRLLKNVGFLSVLQIFNYVAPLLLLPYLTRVLPVEEFGAVMVAMASVMLVFVLTDYGFSLSATYRISQNRDDKNYINKLISQIFTAKIFLTATALIALFAISILPSFYEYRYIFWSGSIAVIAQAYQPIWLFQGLENMKYFVIYMVMTKIFYVALALILVSEPGDGLWVLGSWSVSNLVGALTALFMLKKQGFEISLSSISQAWLELKESAQFFWSRVAVAFYTSASSIIVGTAGLHQAAMYSSAEQGYKAGQAVTTSITQAMYPYMAKEKNWAVFYKVLFSICLIMALGALIVGNFSVFFITFIFGENYKEAAGVLVIMMITLVINFLGVSFGYPALGALDKVEWANKTVIWASFLFCLIAIVLYLNDEINAINIALLVLVTELFVLMVRSFLIYVKLR